MTFPMTLPEKLEHKERILFELRKLYHLTNIARDSILVSDKEDFTSDYILTAKNTTFEISQLAQIIEHRLHELMDATLVEE